MSERTVGRLLRSVNPTTMHRRGFLWRVTLTCAALTVDPMNFAFKPGTAYASVCGVGASCSSGWTAFCCTIHHGANLCPPGSYAAGWWRVDDSAFCRGAARYIIDCNRRPGSACRCRCASGTCDQRRVCCNSFRYGQCNQQIAGTTEVVCRVVTCMPPWRWDSSCTRTVRVDNRTASHSAPCLPGTSPSHIDIKYQDTGMAGAPVGSPISEERSAPGGGYLREYSNGYIAYHPDLGTAMVHGRAATGYETLGGPGGSLGYPLRDRVRSLSGRGHIQGFQGGVIISAPGVGLRAVLDPIRDRYRDLDFDASPLGFPTSGTVTLDDGQGKGQEFEGGAIYHGPPGTVEVLDRYLDAYRTTGGPTGPLGYPLRSRIRSLSGRGHIQGFQGGVIISAPGVGLRAVLDPIRDRYRDLDFDASPLGFPTSGTVTLDDGQGKGQEFEGGAIYHGLAAGTCELLSPYLRPYRRLDAIRGPLGYPVSSRRAVNDGRGWVQDFEHGRFYTDPHNEIRALWGPIHLRYLREGGPVDSGLGYPMSEVELRDDGTEVARFEHGRIVHDPETSETTVSHE